MLKRMLASLLAVVAMACIAGAVRAATAVTRPIFVAAVGPEHATLVWHTADSTTAAVDYGPDLQYGFTVRSKQATTEQRFSMYRLEPGTRYYYRVRCQGDTLYAGPEYFFETLPRKDRTRMRFLAWGDSGKGSSAQYGLVPAMVKAAADFMIHTGDVIYQDGAPEDFTPKYFLPYQDFLRHTPVYLSLGNHDVRYANGQPYLDAFELPANNPAGNERYYSFNWGQAHFVCMDSNGTITDEELAWLEADLKAATTTWKFVFFHHPPYSCGSHGSSLYARSRFVPILERTGVDMVFNGHDHDYQRTFPLRDGAAVGTEQSPYYKNPSGVIYIVTGGGAGPRPTSSSCWFTDAAAAETHFVQVDVDGTHLEVRAIDSQGNVFDLFTIDKTALPAGGAASPATTPRARLLPNFPNPFNPQTRLAYRLDAAGVVRLTVHDVAGHRVRRLLDATRPAGLHHVVWDGRDDSGAELGSGIYFVKLQVGTAVSTRKILLAK